MKKTHRLVKQPRVTARYLAEYMAATETSRRTLIRNCKYQAISRVVQHKDAKTAIGKFFRSGKDDLESLTARAAQLRNMLVENEFEQHVADHNADYIDRFVTVQSKLSLPNAELLPPGNCPSITINGVKVTVELQFRLQRVTRTNKVRIGAGTLRYRKGKNLIEAIGEWQSAFIFGYLQETSPDEAAEPERKLCLTVDAHAGIAYGAPGNALQRYHQMESACATIAERWANIPPPPNARF